MRAGVLPWLRMPGFGPERTAVGSGSRVAISRCDPALSRSHGRDDGLRVRQRALRHRDQRRALDRHDDPRGQPGGHPQQQAVFDLLAAERAQSQQQMATMLSLVTARHSDAARQAPRTLPIPGLLDSCEELRCHDFPQAT